MKTFDFSIIASGLDPEADDFADRFLTRDVMMRLSRSKRATSLWTLRERPALSMQHFVPLSSV